MSETEVLYVEVPRSLKWQVDEDDKTNKNVVIEALEEYYGVSSAESKAVINRQIEREEKRVQETKEEFEELQAELRRREKRLSDMRSILQEREEEKQEYRTRLVELLDDIESGDTPHVWQTSRSVHELADQFGKSPATIMYDLKQLATRQDRDVYNTNFVKRPEAKQMRMDGQEKPIQETTDV